MAKMRGHNIIRAPVANIASIADISSHICEDMRLALTRSILQGQICIIVIYIWTQYTFDGELETSVGEER